jgi:hypothetical protein
MKIEEAEHDQITRMKMKKITTSEAIDGEGLEIFESDFERRSRAIEGNSWNRNDVVRGKQVPVTLRSNNFHRFLSSLAAAKLKRWNEI